MITKKFLERQGRHVPKFTNNIFGRVLVKSLLKRHSNIVIQRLSANIKRARANISKAIIVEYFNNLKESICDIPLSHVFNYDETNKADDYERKRLLYGEVSNIQQMSINTVKKILLANFRLPAYLYSILIKLFINCLIEKKIKT